MYQRYTFAPMVKAGVHYVRLGLVYKPCNLFAGNIRKCANSLEAFLIDVKLSCRGPQPGILPQEMEGCWFSMPFYAILDMC